jgi:hypothetical protein
MKEGITKTTTTTTTTKTPHYFSITVKAMKCLGEK